MRSLESPFQFLNFKIDKFDFALVDDLGLLLSNGQILAERWKFKLGFLQPQFFEKDELYVGGLSLDMVLPGEQKQGADSSENLITLHAEISGAFRCERGKVPTNVEEKLVKNHIPAILMPYMRSAVTGFLASAGYGGVVLPLINMNALAERDMKDVEILVIRE